MTENASLMPEDAAAARAAEQARLRKERREAKIKAGGSARLNKITGLGGGFQRGEKRAQSIPWRLLNSCVFFSRTNYRSNLCPAGRRRRRRAASKASTSRRPRRSRHL